MENSKTEQLAITVGMTIGTILVALSIFTPEVHSVFETLWPKVVGLSFEILAFVKLFSNKKKADGELEALRSEVQALRK